MILTIIVQADKRLAEALSDPHLAGEVRQQRHNDAPVARDESVHDLRLPLRQFSCSLSLPFLNQHVLNCHNVTSINADDLVRVAY